ncbi:MAG: cysteine dioxygenase family protein [Cyclobacteriaceae bacterium]
MTTSETIYPVQFMRTSVVEVDERTTRQLEALRSFCIGLRNKIVWAQGSSLSVIPELQCLKVDRLDKMSALFTTDHCHVLIEDEFVKISLIYWEPGKLSSIHGHPSGGCVFKVLSGQLNEMRYTSSQVPVLLATSDYQTNGIGYIHDEMGYHAVGNSYVKPAYSIHVYSKVNNHN